MNILRAKFIGIVDIILKICLAIITIASAGMCFATFQGFHIVSTVVFSLIIIISFFGGYKIIESSQSNRKKIVLLLLMGAFLRLLWILNTNNAPISDFATMYELGGQIANGNRDVLKGLSYAARFPHMIVTILYIALMRYLFPYSSLIAVKAVNLLLGLIVLVLLYLIARQMFKDEKYQLYTVLMGCLFPPFITYTSVLCSENLAMPFYLTSLLLFLKAMERKNKISIILILSSVSLGIGNLFRMIATVILIAYVIYLLIYSQEHILRRLRNAVCIIMPYVLVLVITSSYLERIGLTEVTLWKGKEPAITSVLKGFNMDNFGMWNAEDASVAQKYIGDYNKIEIECRKIIHDRFTHTSPGRIAVFLVGKLSTQWCNGDFAGSFWTQKDVEDNKITFKVGSMGTLPFQIVYAIALILSFIGLINKKRETNITVFNLLHLILAGYIGAYMISENQFRYGYIVSWIFIFLAIDGLKLLCEKSAFKIKLNEVSKLKI